MSTGLDAYLGWRRLDAKMLLVHPVRELGRFLPALVVIALVGQGSAGNRWELLGVAAAIALGVLRWATTSYRIEGGQIELRRGLLQRSTLTARLDRVRTVELTSSLIHRALGLAKVVVGTGSAGRSGDGLLTLDALALASARALRAQLLHRAAAAVEQPLPMPAPTDAPVAAPAPSPDEVLVTLDPTWVRYAPLTTSGLVIAVGAFGVGSQVLGPLVDQVANSSEAANVRQLPLAVAVPAGLVLGLVIISVLAVTGYLVTNFGFTLSRDRGGRSFHIRRGLLTSKETSLDSDRLRGVEIHEPLGLRLAGGGRLNAIVTGLDKKSRGSTALVPPAPRRVVVAVGETVLREAGPFTAPLVAHGPRARRRRYTRALVGAAVPSALLLLLVLLAGWSAWVLVVVPLLAAGALPLARDRYAGLGHALLPHYVVTRSGSFRGRRDALLRAGIIGWNIEQTFFQRRAGLCTLTATTAAGQQAYRVFDVALPTAVALAHEATPDLLAPFLAESEALASAPSA